MREKKDEYKKEPTQSYIDIVKNNPHCLLQHLLNINFDHSGVVYMKVKELMRISLMLILYRYFFFYFILYKKANHGFSHVIVSRFS